MGQLVITAATCPSTHGLECEEASNPRLRGYCVRCGHRMPPKPAPVRRVPELEREIVEEAARGAVDPDDMIRFAQTRAIQLSGEYVKDPLTILPGRDRPRDAREELADTVNHVTFHIQEHPDDPRNPDYLIGLRFVALAYEYFKVDE